MFKKKNKKFNEDNKNISKLDYVKLRFLFSMLKLEDLKIIESDLVQIIEKKEKKLCKVYKE